MRRIYKMLLRLNSKATDRRLVLLSGLDENIWPQQYAELTDELGALEFARSKLLRKSQGDH